MRGTDMTVPGEIRLEGVTKTYRSRGEHVEAVADITLDIDPGSSVAIVGPSGAGKSTLIALVGALDVPDDGRVVVGGCTVSALGERARAKMRRREYGYVFQSDNLLPFLTARENVELQRSLAGRPPDFVRCQALLHDVGIVEFADRLPDALSGGQRQRVALARALAHEPRILIADEPTASLDHANAAAVIELLVRVQRTNGSTLVIVTHDVSVAERLDRTVCLADGRVASDTGSASVR